MIFEKKTFFTLNDITDLNTGHLNINSIRNKFESIKPIISPNFAIFSVSEAKLYESVPNNQSSKSGYRMFRQSRTYYCLQAIKFTFR